MAGDVLDDTLCTLASITTADRAWSTRQWRPGRKGSATCGAAVNVLSIRRVSPMMIMDQGGRRMARRRVHLVQMAGMVGAAAVLIMGSAVVAAPSYGATVLTVTTTADGGPGSLRAALAQASSSTDSDVRIQLGAGPYVLTICGGDDGGGDLDLAAGAGRTVTLTGAAVIRQTCAGERVLEQSGEGHLVLSGVTVTGGALQGTAETPADGGGVRAEGSVTLDGATVSGNSATGGAGRPAPIDQASEPGGTARGGGLWVAASLTAGGAVVSGNRAVGGPGADAVGTTPDDPADDGNAASGGPAEGGGAWVAGEASVQTGAATGNAADGGDGGRSGRRPGGGGHVGGGALYVAGTASFRAVELTGNQARGGDAGLMLAYPVPADVPFPTAGRADGGAVTAPVLSARDLTATGNAATGGSAPVGPCFGVSNCRSAAEPGEARGGALAGDTVTLDGGTFRDNRAASGHGFTFPFPRGSGIGGTLPAAARGGAVAGGASLRTTGGTFAGNRAESGEGRPSIDGPAAGGALAATGDLTVTGGSFTDNTSNGRGGAVDGTAVVLADGAFNGNRAGGRGGAVSAASLSAAGVTVTGNTADGTGGGGLSATGPATVRRASVTGNTVATRWIFGAGDRPAGGGGLSVFGALTLTDSTVRDNRGSARLAGGYFCPDCPAGFVGGGIRAGSLTAVAVTVAGNLAVGITPPPDAPAIFGPVQGGGIATEGAAILVNATIDGNGTTPYPDIPPDTPLLPNAGAAVHAGSISLDHATVTANSAGAPVLSTPALISNRSVAIAGAGQSLCTTGTVPVASGWNWFADTSCALAGPGDEQQEAAFLLGPLADNGGPVPTRLPAEASVLVDRVPPAACPVPTDARGVTRPLGGACDVGAVELVLDPAPPPTDLAVRVVDAPNRVVPGSSGTWRIDVTNRGPNPATPAVAIAVSTNLGVTAASAPGASCATGPLTTCLLPTLEPGASTTVTVTGRIDPATTVPVELAAEVVARNAGPPRADDRITHATPVRPTADLRMTVRGGRSYDQVGHVLTSVTAEVVVEGPSHATGTEIRPIEVTFTPAAGVQVVDATGVPTAVPVSQRFVGSFPPGARLQFSAQLVAPGRPPAVVGSVRPGTAVDPDTTGHTVRVGTADLGVTAVRPATPQPAGAPTTFTIEVTNRGPAIARDVWVELAGPTDRVTPDRGTVDPDRSRWTIPELAVGATARLDASYTPYPYDGSIFTTRVSSAAADYNDENDGAVVTLGRAAEGTADLRVDRLTAARGPATDQRTLRAVIVNDGPLAADEVVVRSLWPQVDAVAVAMSSPTPGWSCFGPDDEVRCVSAAPLPPGGRAEIEVILEGVFTDRQPRPGVEVSSTTIDSDLGNNWRRVTPPV
jgi:hypothetical protein